MSEEKTIEAGNSLPQPLGSAAFSVWSEARGVWPRLTHEEIFRAGWDAAIAAATAHVKEDESLNMLRELRNYLKERFQHSRDAPGHSHVIDGRWDNDGSECSYCSLWKRINQKLSNKDVSDERD